jgi:membrane protease YdiL (CAAX protease family)
MLSPTFGMLTVGQPLLEEVLFRGYLQGYCREQPWGQRAWCGITRANMLTALVFTAGHIWTHPLLWALAVLVPALIFGASRDRYGSIYPGLLLHVLYNAGYFGLSGLPEGV